MMTSDEIQYVRAWAASGNEARFCAVDAHYPGVKDGVGMRLPECAWEMLDEHGDSMCRLSDTGLTIARLADALEQANETAEMHAGEMFDDVNIETMRKNRAELLGDA